MQLTVKGKHLDVGDSLRGHVHVNLSHTASKYFQDPVEATVVFTKEKGHRYCADISMHIGRGILLQAEHETDDPYTAFDGAAGKLATRLSRYKDKLRDHHRKENVHDIHEAAYTTFQPDERSAEATVVAEMQMKVPTLAVSDAVMRLELSEAPALMFRNPANGQYNMVYRRKDGNIGWVDPAEARAAAKAEKTMEKPAAKRKRK